MFILETANEIRQLITSFQQRLLELKNTVDDLATVMNAKEGSSPEQTEVALLIIRNPIAEYDEFITELTHEFRTINIDGVRDSYKPREFAKFKQSLELGIQKLSDAIFLANDYLGRLNIAEQEPEGRAEFH